jgi:hypothetical protein
VIVSKREGGQGRTRTPWACLRGKIHLSHGGRKAHLGFELKDAPKARGLRPSQILDFKIQTRSGQPCDEWGGVAGAASNLSNAGNMPIYGRCPQLAGEMQLCPHFPLPMFVRMDNLDRITTR